MSRILSFGTLSHGVAFGLALAGAVCFEATAAPLEFHVSAVGSDENPGDEAQPFRSLERARDAIRAATGRSTTAGAPGAGWDGAIIHLRGGLHVLSQPLRLDGRDSGTEARPLLIRPLRDETPVLGGGVPVPPGAWKPVADPVVVARLNPAVRNIVRQLDLREIGVKEPGRLGIPGSRIDLVVGGVVQTLARWPASGWATVASLPQGAAAGAINVTEDRLKDWTLAPNTWTRGYWSRDNRDTWYPLDSFAPTSRVLHLAPPWNAEGFRAGQWFEVLNVLEELDAPGEWYLDEARLRIFCVPPTTGLSSARVNTTPSILVAEGAAWFELRGLTLEGTRSHGIVVRDGVGPRLADLTVRNVGGWGIRIEGGGRATLSGVTVTGAAEGGVLLRGGDRASLAGGNHTIESSRIAGFGRVKRTGNPGILLEGVGARVASTIVEDGPHAGLEFRGNDHVVEDSTFRRLCLETGDAGAIHAVADWSFRGNIIRRNVIEDVNHSGLPGTGVVIEKPAGIYLQDHVSGTTISANTFRRCGVGVRIDGGRDNVVDANSFTACATPIFLGEGLASGESDQSLRNALQAVPHASPTWTARYPALVGLLDNTPRSPANNAITNNRVLDGAWLVDAAATVRSFVPLTHVNFTSANASVALAQLVAFPIASPEAPFEGLSFYVAINGSDGAAGTEAAPFATITRARDAIRAATGRTSGPATLGSSWKGARVTLKAGTHALASTFVLDARDGGTEAFPVTYRGEPGATAVVTTAALVPDSAWKLIAQQSDDSFAWSRLPAASRGKVYRLDVGALGIDKGGLGADSAGVTNWLMPIVNGRIRQMARWPNGPILEASGWRIIDAVNSDGGKTGESRITINSATPASWNWSSEELLAYGHWAHDWTAHWQSIRDVVASGSGASQIVLGGRDWIWELGGDAQRKIFFANTLQMLEREGSYVWNLARGVLYYLPVTAEGPPADTRLTRHHAVIQNGLRWPDDPVNAADWLTLQDLVLEGARETLIQAQYSVGMVLRDCILRNSGGTGASFRFGSKNKVVGGRFFDLVTYGLTMRGMGDLRTFSDGECLIEGVTFDGTGWFAHGSASAINIGANWNTPPSCGVVVRNNIIRNVAGVGLFFTAARVLVEGNTFERVVQLDGDAGAAYAGGRMTHRGNIVRGNTFRNIVRHPLNHPSWGALTGVYIDDSFSGVTIEENTFENCDHGIFLMSGKDNIARRNTFTECHSGHSRAPIYLGSRVGWDQGKIDEDLSVVPVDREPWTSLYPDLVKMRPGGSLHATRMRPTGNQIVDNLTTTGTHLARVSGNVAGDHDATRLNFAINDPNPANRRALSAVWVLE